MGTSNPLDRRTVAGTSLSASQRRQRAKIAAHASWAARDGQELGARGQAGLMARFEREVDPDGVLPPAERERRAESAKRAHFQRMAYARHKA